MTTGCVKTKAELSYDYISHLKKFHAAWRLLSSDLAPFTISFLHKTFLQANRRSISVTDLTDELDQFLYVLAQKHPADAPTRSAREYIESWSSPEVAWLSQRYTGRNDTPEVDLTPDAEKALRWIENLHPRTFVGTESRLLTIFQLLKDLNEKLETDPALLLADLEKKKNEIEEQIHLVRQGPTARRLDSTQIRERYFQLDDTANTLIGDFRQIEENFRKLDRDVREKIALTNETKGNVIEDIFGEQDAISDSDQGRSFRAFWEFLIHNDRQSEFETLLARVLREPEVSALPDKGILPLFRDFLVEAGNKVYVVNNVLTSQLSKYLADKGRAENKRIAELVSRIEKHALSLKEIDFPKAFFSVDHLKPRIELTLNRPLFRTPDETPLLAPEEKLATDQPDAAALDQLFESHHVDERELMDIIERVLQDRNQVSLEDLLIMHPLSRGLAELITYLKIAEIRPHSSISDQRRFQVEITNETKVWARRVRCPVVIFQRTSS